ncbi:MAG: L-serine ammonia-lyase, iron-sulfur-dependent, subunit alpha [Pseudodesulfovibrio sp.]|uniref:L-serine ammonia-lyase n=1 Tax=Pseudodesulfovibrio aespoeensis (strain ATCC 700646 / DSM 10631 / Aspo-2) TaxID=643562 RepID=E6VYZ1_PSEA9|nr:MULTISPECIES: L-serine ammonia-lyase, iron-sulfur-dependent, subunit alpha [Pseudodesulfovibrio]MBU4474078.1 L-serine ammonia-lyase, iron-sulfur-dependent, subunit alpha [Pseudomonadota bacterium]ADU61654.1 L-serine ammonia-lyase [Pseudodesulfovibrio aespoeensis Aspo-2]MBU4517755.1 L-serine ammonia-lyase, iron-sulfur-dependent, subunit alpha [Pseudomonadota bacterium]MBU4522187.1 L-serine ammonia-lyase, iron-sulfur-dependent, subunit alpha [Pseudomonadota bacterium]MBU4559087.1 L-serine amm
MDSLKELYKVGNGPSSSHTMGPQKAAKSFMSRTPNAARYQVTLLGSLAATGKGHLTDWIIEQTLGPERTRILWKPDEVRPFHTNGMVFEALDELGGVVDSWEAYSVGGGTIAEADAPNRGAKSLYPHTTLAAIMEYCKVNTMELWQYVEKQEGPELWPFLKDIWQAMLDSMERGLECTGVLPGTLRYPRKANTFFKKARTQSGHLRSVGKLFAYALAVSEENASGGRVVTAPTCGSAGLIPAVLRSLQEDYALEEQEILRALAVGGLIGNLVKENASISGAEVGCQGEIGTACAMAGAIAAYLFGGSLMQIDYAAEMSLEHHLGMTCDPVGGYVQVPCIERNAISSIRAINAAQYALFTNGEHRISFDQVVQTMGETGRDLKCGYRETSMAGLAKHGLMDNCGTGC